MVYECINNNGGWDNWIIEVIDTIEPGDRTALLCAERYWINKLKPTLNTNKVMPTVQEQKEARQIYSKQKYIDNKDYYKDKAYEYRVNNPEWYKAYQGEYRKKHREALNARYRQKFKCECGGSFTYVNRLKHLQTHKHKAWVAANQNEPTLSTSPETGSS